MNTAAEAFSTVATERVCSSEDAVDDGQDFRSNFILRRREVTISNAAAVLRTSSLTKTKHTDHDGKDSTTDRRSKILSRFVTDVDKHKSKNSAY